MKALFSFLSCLIMLALFTRCADDELDGSSDGLPEKGLVVRLSTGGGLETKTPLNSTGAYHHVQEVWAVLYKWNGDEPAADAPNDYEDYEFISAQRLEWNPSQPAPDRTGFPSDEAYEDAYERYVLETGGAYGNGSIQQKDFELSVDADGATLPPATYRVLCLGLDDTSREVYNLKTNDNQLNEDIFAQGKTLADVYATLLSSNEIRSDGKDPDEGGDDDPVDLDSDSGFMVWNKDYFSGELFAGWAEFRFEPDNLNVVEVEMKRRVAGILCYVTDIPKLITADGEQPVKGIRLALYTGGNTNAKGSAPNDRIHLCRLEDPQERLSDFGELTETAPWFAGDDGYTTLAYYALPNQGTTDDIYQFNYESVDLSGGVKLKDNSILMGAYLIPIAKGNKPTLVVQLIGGEGAEYAAIGYPEEKEGTAKVKGKILATFNATRSAAGVETGGTDAFDVQCYDILPNYIYHIGNKPEPDGTDKDEPVSLLGQKITVTPMEWDKSYKIPVEYPSVSIESTLQLVDENYSPYAKDYKFDCIGIDDDNNEAYRDEYYMGAPYNKRLFLKVTVNVLKTGWKLEIVGNDMTTNGGPEDRMLFISNKNADGSYTYSTSREVDKWEKTDYIPLLLTSYAENDKSKLDRSVILKLTPKDKYGNLQTEKAQTLSVTQYNALIADLDKGYGTRGYSHVDWNDGETVNWGYVYLGSAYPDWIYDNYDHGTCWNYGGTLYVNAKKNTKSGLFHTTKREYFLESAIYKCATKFLIIDNNYSKDMTSDTDKVWYLPARRELSAFLQNYPDEAGDTQYWSSTAYSYQDAYYNYYIEDDKKVFDEVSREDMNKVHRRNKTLHAMRAACMIEGVTD